MSNQRFVKIGGYFKKLRNDSGLSQAELADKLGFTGPQIVSNWERGVCAPPLRSIVQMTSLFKLAPEEVMDLLIEENREFLKRQFKVSKKIVRR